ncbi:MAG: hypothetical protein V1872_13050 [bacterium]
MRINKRYTFFFIIIAICSIIVSTYFLACAPVGIGNSLTGYKSITNVKIQPAEAVKLAEQYLDKTFELRKASSDLQRSPDKAPIIVVILGGNYYYIVKESFPAISRYFYMKHAVKVHKNSGKVIPPE